MKSLQSLVFCNEKTTKIWTWVSMECPQPITEKWLIKTSLKVALSMKSF